MIIITNSVSYKYIVYFINIKYVNLSKSYFYGITYINKVIFVSRFLLHILKLFCLDFYKSFNKFCIQNKQLTNNSQQIQTTQNNYTK